MIDYIPSIAVGSVTIGITYLYIYRPSKLLVKGDFDGAMRIFEKMQKKRWLGRTVQQTTIFNISEIHHRTGRFEKSIATLDRMPQKRLSKNLRGVRSLLYGANLLMLGRNLDTAEVHLQVGESLVQHPSFSLFYAYLDILRDDLESAKRNVNQYLKSSPGNRYKFGQAVLVFDREFFSATDNFFLGCYYQALDDSHKAKEHFENAASCSYENYFSSKASELLASLD
ncbi:MAG: hypothetical protein Q8J63_05005 [Candidatus Aquicultor sp.]|nr:hypothetical protein [Candidatus Aquicultor sp.]